MTALSNFLENTLVDVLLRGQNATINGKTLSWSAAPTLYFSLHTADPTDAGTGAEVSGGSYARVAVTAALANFAGTQGAGTTLASSGTGGVTSNNGAVTFPAPTANWGVATHVGLWDASSGGNMLASGALTASKTINNGDAAPSFAAGAFQLTFA